MLVNLKSLIGRVNPTARTVLEGAAGLCVSRTHYDVEVEHFLVKLLEFPDSDFDRIVRYFDIDKVRLSAELARSLDRLKTGNARTPAFNSQLMDAFIKGWTYGSLELGSTVIRTGFVVFALIADDELSRLVFEFTKEMHKIEREALRRNFSQIVAGSAEDELVAVGPLPSAKPKVSGGPHIFISYRREDSASYADFLFFCLEAEVPDVHIFHDTDTLRPGMVFSEKIEETVGACDVLLALIGKKWTGAKKGATPRIVRDDDWVRLEIAAALNLKKWVIPCLVGGAKMPAKADLPPDLAALPGLNAVLLSQNGMRRDVDVLLESLKKWRRGA